MVVQQVALKRNVYRFNVLIDGVDRGTRALSEPFAGMIHSYCRLETVDNGVLVADDGSLINLLHLEDSLKHMCVEE